MFSLKITQHSWLMCVYPVNINKLHLSIFSFHIFLLCSGTFAKLARHLQTGIFWGKIFLWVISCQIFEREQNRTDKVWEGLTREVSKYLFIERKLRLECFEVAKLFQAGHPTFCKHALRIFFFKMDVHINRVTSNAIQILRNKSLYVWNVKSTWLG